ncbi:hypothetical protein [Rhizobium laguerreae]|uniref:hypothetical protein n=1 Tax=Rhizobium laguerreae TaxID=1076926 RepID=UPI001C8FB71C|nr:hypothetical protein [Rhizobium laguerreae]MBY3167377.1 hypothetical protein [Rhizobium laguerreae]
MKTTTTVIHGLAFDVLVIETMHADAVGTLFYRAEILIRHRQTGVQRLVQRTRIPGTGQALARDVQSRGIRALAAFRPVA